MRFILFNRYHHKTTSDGNRFPLSILPAVIIGLILSGCASVGPDYTKVKPDAPIKWHTELAGGLITEELQPETLANWWSTLNDAELESLVARAVKGNLDIKNAHARIREARALRGVSRADLFPTLDAGGSAIRSRSSENSGAGKEIKLYSAGFDAGWELDIFGGARRAIEAAQADLEVTQEDLHDILVSLLAEVALNYVEVRTYQARLAVTETNIKSQEEIFELNRSRYQAGIIDDLAVQQSLYNLENIRSQIPTLQTRLEAAKNRLAVLLGKKPGDVHQELAEKKPIPMLPVTVAVGVPAETLRNRPDIRRAERNLAAQTARIGVAVADLYPKFRLMGTIGLESISTGNFLESASRTWSIGPDISWSIFHGGAIRQNIKVRSALQEQALIQYESVVLSAQEEVENVLIAYAKEQRRRESLAKATDAAKRTVLLSRDQYQAGLVDFSNVLIAQRSLLSFQDQLAQSEGAVISNLVRLYKALGGGWKYMEPAANRSDNLAKEDST
ncbi:MAG: efflux transporter outer membrane subunit [Thermodesulfobacteriota bacterium]|nr:efflux transporter outer membrane subunit [Thermodesulfobacteriota bacterium]